MFTTTSDGFPAITLVVFNVAQVNVFIMGSRVQCAKEFIQQVRHLFPLIPTSIMSLGNKAKTDSLIFP